MMSIDFYRHLPIGAIGTIQAVPLKSIHTTTLLTDNPEIVKYAEGFLLVEVQLLFLSLLCYSKDVQPFADYNMPFVPRAPLWRRAAEIQSSDGMAGVQRPQFEHSRLLVDYPAPPPPSMQQQQQLDSTSTDDMADVQQPHIEHSMLLIDYPPPPPPPPNRQQLGSASNEPPPGDRLQRPLGVADQQTPTQEALVAPEQMVASQVPQQDSPVYQVPGDGAPQGPGQYQYGQWLGQPTFSDGTITQRKGFFGTPVQPEGPVFRSSGPYPIMSPPPAYSPQGPSPWGVVRAGPLPAYPQLVRGAGPAAGAQPVSPYDDWGTVRKAESVPIGVQQQMGGPLGTFGAVDRMGPVMYPAYGRVPMAPAVQYEGAGVGEREQSQAAEGDKNNEQEPHHEEQEEESAEDLKDAVDVEEEVVPALVVFLRKKGHKALHDKDSVGIPGKENRFRRSPGGGSGSSSHSSASSSSSSGPVYFGDGGGSYSSSQSSASSSSGGGAPLGFGGSGQGLGGSGSFYGGAQVPPSGYGASGYGGSGLGGGYGGVGGSGHGGGGYGATGYGPGYGSGGGGGGSGLGGYGSCATCGGGGDENVLLNRFGAADESSGPFTVGGSGVSTGKGVHASSSSSIDSTGKITYSTFAGKH